MNIDFVKLIVNLGNIDETTVRRTHFGGFVEGEEESEEVREGLLKKSCVLNICK